MFLLFPRLKTADKNFVLFFLLSLILGRADAQDIPHIDKNITGAIISIYGYNDQNQQITKGPGLVFKDSGWIVTNYHLLAGTTKLVAYQNKKKLKLSSVARIDVEKDIAALRLSKNKQKIPAFILAKPIEGESALITGKTENGEFFEITSTFSAPENDEGSSNGLMYIDKNEKNPFAVTNKNGSLTGITSVLKKGDTNVVALIPIHEIIKNKMPVTDSIYSKTYYLLYRGIKEYENRNYEEAHRYLTRYLKINGKDDVAYYYRANCRSKLKNYNDAIADYFISSSINPNSARVYKESAYACRMANQSEAALEDYNLGIILDPTDDEMYLNRGVLKGQMQDHSGAEKDFLAAVKLNSSNAEAYYHLGTVKMIGKDYKSALEYFDKAILLNFEHAEMFNNRGIAHSELNEVRAAINDFTTAVKINPKLDGAFANRGNMKMRLNNFSGAINDFTKAVELNPDYAEAYFNRGIAKHDLKQFTEAISDFNKAIKLKPEIGIFYFIRANAKQQMGDITGACTDWSKAGELGYNKAYEMIKVSCR